MKHNFITLLFAIVASIGTMFASDTSVEGIWYDLDNNMHTATVTYQGDSYFLYSSEYSGDLVIPSTITYNDILYDVTGIGFSAFYECSGLTSVTIPSSVYSIDISQTFHNCTSLTSINVDAENYTFSSIDGVLFDKNQTKLIAYPCGKSSIYAIPNGVTEIGDYAFESCSALTFVSIPNGVTSIGWSAFTGCSALTSIEFPGSLTSIRNYAFIGCNSLTSIEIPNTLTSIGATAFRNCLGLASIDVATDNPNYSSLDGILFNKEQTTLIQYPLSRQGAYAIPGSVKSIEESAFESCYGLTTVTIPDGLTNIGYAAFRHCTGLSSVTIPNSVTHIGGSAFWECKSLTSMTLPNRISIIKSATFDQCAKLSSVTIPKSVTEIENLAFRDCRYLSSITNYNRTPQKIYSSTFEGVKKSSCTLYVPQKSVDAYKAADIWKDFVNIVGVDVPEETIEGDYTIYYVDKDFQDLTDEIVTLHVPVAPTITGFTFVGWQASGMLADGITLQAVYKASTPTSAPDVVTNHANPAQKLIRNGNVYILRGDHTYTLTGQQVK